MIASTLRRISQLAFVLAIWPQWASADDCPAGAKAFPSSKAGSGKVQYANLFAVTYHGSYKVIEFSETLSTYKSSHPAKAGEPIPPIVLYQCGTQKPVVSDSGIGTSDARFFEIPLERATIAWGGPLPAFEMLSLTEAIYLIDMTYISSPCTQLMEECTPGIHMSAYDAAYKATASNNSVVFTDSFGTGYSNTSWDVEFQNAVDPGILNRAEWIRFVSFFFNEEEQADTILSKIESDYNALKDLANQLKVDASTEWVGREPQVLWVNSQPETCADPATNCDGGATQGWIKVSGSWCHCGQLYKITTSFFKRDLVQHAGGRLVALPATEPDGCTMQSNTDGSQTFTYTSAGLATYKALLVQADAIIDETYIAGHDTTAHDFEGSFSVTSSEIPALARDPRNIFRLDGTVSDDEPFGSVGTAWFDDARSQPQQLLAGMMEMLWSTSFDSPCGMKYFRRAIPGVGQTQLGHDDCPLYDAGGNHDCAGIHDLMHAVPQCAPAVSKNSNEVSSAVGATLSVAIALSTLWLALA